MDAIARLDKLLSKTVKGISAGKRMEAVRALSKLYQDSHDGKLLAEYLMRLHHSVAQIFFETVVSNFPREEMISVSEALISDKRFISNAGNSAAYSRGFTSTIALAKKGNYDAAFLILSRLLSLFEKSDGFPDGCKNGFKKYVAEVTDLATFQNLADKVGANELNVSEDDHKRLKRFIDEITEDNIVKKCEAVNASNTSTSYPSEKKDTPAVHTNAESTEQPANDALTAIANTQGKMMIMLQQLVNNRIATDSVTSTLNRKESEIVALRSELAERDKQIDILRIDRSERDRRISDNEAKIADLTERLRDSLKMDARMNNQELIKLKNDISGALKLEYSDFQKNKQEDYSSDLFDAYRAALTRIFKLLRRFEINCE